MTAFASAEARLVELGIVLPEPLRVPEGMVLPFPWVNIRGDRAYISGHGPQEQDGSPAGPFGKVGDVVTVAQGYASARKVGLSILGSLRRELGSLDRIAGWARVHGMINCAAGFADTPSVLNGFTDLILDVFGPEIGRHARTAVGVAGLRRSHSDRDRGRSGDPGTIAMLTDRLQAELDRRLARIADERPDEPWRVLPRADRIALLLLVAGSMIGVFFLRGF